jgi:hypothetical protein
MTVQLLTRPQGYAGRSMFSLLVGAALRLPPRGDHVKFKPSLTCIDEIRPSSVQGTEYEITSACYGRTTTPGPRTDVDDDVSVIWLLRLGNCEREQSGIT